MIDNIIIITPAIIRPIIHTVSIASLYKSLDGYKKHNIKITHIINIDSPDKLLKIGYNLKDTINNLDKLIPDDVIKKYLINNKPTFTDSYCRIWIEANKYATNNSIILYFEDDWNFKKIFNWFHILDNITETIPIDTPYILTNQLYIDNSPHMMSYKYYEQYYNYFKKEGASIMQNNTDPDIIRHLFGKFYLKKIHGTANIKYNFMFYVNEPLIKYGEPPHIFYNYESTFNIIDLKTRQNIHNSDKKKFECYIYMPTTPNIVNDLGRKWMKLNNLIKWNKGGQDIKTY